jgi:cytidylate kinase
MKSIYPTLPPEVEHRISAWQQVRFRAARRPEPAPGPTITLSRQFGCEAFPLAQRLEEKLNEISRNPWVIYDRILIEQVAKEAGISLYLLKELGDPDSDLDILGLNAAGHITHQEAFAAVARRLRDIAAQGNAIVIGRGDAVLCRSMKNCYHFRIEASLDWRIGSLARRLNLPAAEARELIRTSGAHRENFINSCVGSQVSDFRHYDAMFNNERHSVEQMAAAIVAYVKLAWPDQGSRPMVRSA